MSNDMRGYLFKNEKRGNEKHPLYMGKITVGGKTFDLAGWLNESDERGKYLSLKVSEPRKKSAPASLPKGADDLDDIPW